MDLKNNFSDNVADFGLRSQENQFIIRFSSRKDVYRLSSQAPRFLSQVERVATAWKHRIPIAVTAESDGRAFGDCIVS